MMREEEKKELLKRQEENNMIFTFPPDILEEAEIPGLNLPGLGDCKVHIFDNEGPYIPHFHIKNDSGNKLNCAVKLFEADYFIHGQYKDKLNSKQRKELDKWLRSKSKDSFTTNWEEIVARWNNTFNRQGLKLPTMPNYKDLPIIG